MVVCNFNTIYAASDHYVSALVWERGKPMLNNLQRATTLNIHVCIV